MSRLDITRDQYIPCPVLPAVTVLGHGNYPGPLRVIPRLTDLELVYTDTLSFETLAAAPDLLPNLRRVTFRTNYPVPVYFSHPESWEPLLAMLTSRRLQSFRFIFVITGRVRFRPADVLETLRQLANDRMNLYFGYHDRTSFDFRFALSLDGRARNFET
ncbi:hypothetical protein C8R47DRAFT_511080 [Mycena vitilis]|nr:hypothetical protein C8R47DRAFT_511080 [Mycena vitilis]